MEWRKRGGKGVAVSMAQMKKYPVGCWLIYLRSPPRRTKVSSTRAYFAYIRGRHQGHILLIFEEDMAKKMDVKEIEEEEAEAEAEEEASAASGGPTSLGLASAEQAGSEAEASRTTGGQKRNEFCREQSFLQNSAFMHTAFPRRRIQNDPTIDKVIWIRKRELAVARHRALKSAYLEKVTRFLGLCTFSWSTVVLLGGFPGELFLPDFIIVTVLILMETARFACSLFFNNLVRKKHPMSLSSNPKAVLFYQERRRFSSFIRWISVTGQVLIMLPSVPLCVWRLVQINRSHEHHYSVKLRMSLSLCYILVSTYSTSIFIAHFCMQMRLHTYMYRCFEMWRQCDFHLPRETYTQTQPESTSIKRYFDEVRWRALQGHIAHAEDFDVCTFFMDLLAEAFALDVQPIWSIYKDYKDFFEYLLAHPDGFQLVHDYLNSENSSKQRAFIYIVYFWCRTHNPHLRRKLLNLSPTFLCKLKAKMDERGARIGCDAANALAALIICLVQMEREDFVKSMDYLNMIHMLHLWDDSQSIADFAPEYFNDDSWCTCYLHLLVVLLEVSGDTIRLSERMARNLRLVLSRWERNPRIKVLAGYALLKAGFFHAEALVAYKQSVHKITAGSVIREDTAAADTRIRILSLNDVGDLDEDTRMEISTLTREDHYLHHLNEAQLLRILWNHFHLPNRELTRNTMSRLGLYGN